MPLLISMFSANFINFKQDMNENIPGRWTYYLDCLKAKNCKNQWVKNFIFSRRADGSVVEHPTLNTRVPGSILGEVSFF